MIAFTTVLALGGWVWAAEPSAGLLAAASGAAFAAVVLGQLANAFACRSETRWVGATGLRGNPLLLGAVICEAGLLALFLGFPPLADLLGGSPPPLAGWIVAALAIPSVVIADALHKYLHQRRVSVATAAVSVLRA